VEEQLGASVVFLLANGFMNGATLNTDKRHKTGLISMKPQPGSPGMTPGLTLLFAVAGALAVGNLYWAQPLLAEISAALDVPLAATGALVTGTQVGYAAGVLLLVPLGDLLNRRRLIPLVMALSALALLACAMAPSYLVLLCSLIAVGATTVSGQILVPLAGDLARDDQRGRVIGSIVSGILIGILMSRTISGLVAEHFGWRAIYLAASTVTLALAACLARTLPPDRPRQAVSYGTLLISVGYAVRGSRAVQVTLAIGACMFCVFTMFWTGLTFLLSSPAFAYSVTEIGLVGLVGLAGALAARRAGRLHDRGWSTRSTGAALFLALLSVGIAAAGGTSIALVLLAVLLIDIAIQGINVLNQTRLISIRPEARSRLNTAFVVCNFVGGAAGSMLAGLLWQTGGWTLLTAAQAIIVVLALGVWTLGRDTLKAVEVEVPSAPVGPDPSR
jgi:predicted MFS family arabinose efflux permease